MIHQPAFGYYGYPRDSSFLYIFQERHSFSFLPPPPIGNSRVVNSSIRKVNLITEIPHSAIWTCFFLILFMGRKMGWSYLLFKGPSLAFIIAPLPHFLKWQSEKLIKVIIIIPWGNVRIGIYKLLSFLLVWYLDIILLLVNSWIIHVFFFVM